MWERTKKLLYLLKEYDRVVLACGASTIRRDIKAPGRDAKGIYFAVDFLKSHDTKHSGQIDK